MKLRTFRGKTMAEALSEVKKGLGKEAVILHTRAFRVGGVLGFGGRDIIEITASDAAVARGPRIRTPSGATAPASGDRFERTAPSAAASPAAIEPKPPSLRDSRLATIAAPAPVSPGAADDLRAELASIKRLVGQVLQCSRHAAASVGGAGRDGAASLLALGGVPDALFTLFMRLQEQGLAGDAAESLVSLVRSDLAAEELADARAVRQGVLRRLAERIPVVGSMTRAGATPDGRPLTIALVGPTGVGKTTTLAKLAAAYKLRQGKSVALITADTYRIAAVDQLRTYANIIGLPLKVAMTPEEMNAACDACAGLDVLLIDTAGRSQHDRTRLAELRAFIAAARPHETHLALAATASEAVLADAAERFQPLGPDRVIFTKLDEAVTFGPLVNALSRTGLRASFITTGQEVPDQIEVAAPDRLARAVLDGEVPR